MTLLVGICKLSFSYNSKQRKTKTKGSNVLNNLKCICIEPMLFSTICQFFDNLMRQRLENPGPVPGNSFSNSFHTDSFSSVSTHQSSRGL